MQVVYAIRRLKLTQCKPVLFVDTSHTTRCIYQQLGLAEPNDVIVSAVAAARGEPDPLAASFADLAAGGSGRGSGAGSEAGDGPKVVPLTDEELHELQDAFSQCDPEHSGRILGEDLRSVLAQLVRAVWG